MQNKVISIFIIAPVEVFLLISNLPGLLMGNENDINQIYETLPLVHETRKPM